MDILKIITGIIEANIKSIEAGIPLKITLTTFECTKDFEIEIQFYPKVKIEGNENKN